VAAGLGNGEEQGHGGRPVANGRPAAARLPSDWMWLASMAVHQTQERLAAGNETLACAPHLLIQLCAVWVGP
jgi:hypothetical protein